MEKAKSFTREMSWLHSWSGLIFGWLLVPIFVTGSICVFYFEIGVWAKPEAHAMRVAEPAALVAFSEAHLKKAAPDSRLWQIILPDVLPRDPFLRLGWLDKDGKPAGGGFAPDGSGPQARTPTIGGLFFVRFHYALNILPWQKHPLGLLIVGLAGIAFLANVIAGVVVHKRIFKDFFTFRPKAKSEQRKWLDAHNVLSVLPLPFHFLIVLTGFAVFCWAYIPSGIATLYNGSDDAFHVDANLPWQGLAISEFSDLKGTQPGASARTVPLALLLARAQAEFSPERVANIVVRDPGRANAVVEVFGSDSHDHDPVLRRKNTPRIAFDGASGRVIRIQHGRPLMATIADAASALHFASFGGTAMRLLYLVAGMTGAVMMATGQLVFTIKRREKAVSPGAERFFKIVDRVNVATIAGVCFASAAHLWAIRLLPYDLAARPAWEVNIFFIAWGIAFLHAAVRPPGSAWIEQLAATALLCIALPVLGFMVPNSNLFAMIAKGDWKTAGVDLGSVVFGVLFASTAWVISGKRASLSMYNRSLQGA